MQATADSRLKSLNQQNQISSTSTATQKSTQVTYIGSETKPPSNSNPTVSPYPVIDVDDKPIPSKHTVTIERSMHNIEMDTRTKDVVVMKLRIKNDSVNNE